MSTETYIRLHAAMKYGIDIGAHSVIGLGSIVIKDVPAYVSVMGNPARIISMREEGEKVFK